MHIVFINVILLYVNARGASICYEYFHDLCTLEILFVLLSYLLSCFLDTHLNLIVKIILLYSNGDRVETTPTPLPESKWRWQGCVAQTSFFARRDVKLPWIDNCPMATDQFNFCKKKCY